MHVVIVSTYPPRKCGIATFSRDLRRAMLSAEPSTVVEIAASLRPDGTADEQAPEVVHTFQQDDPGDYPATAEDLNRLAPDAVIIEHEYGIYGGADGEQVLRLVEGLTVPYAVTLHTVLADPSPHQAEVLEALCRGARWVFCFSPRARTILTERHHIPADTLHIVAHGAPEDLIVGNGIDEAQQRAELRGMGAAVEGRTLLSTFGLLSPGKGLETAIRAMPAVVAAHPEVLYVVAGRTHPEIVKHDGEAYREGLEELVRELRLDDHVVFANGYLTDEQLQALLGQTQIFVTPYRSKEQIVSGALTFAVAAGCAVVSTPYYYAEDMVRAGTGWLVPFDDPEAMAAKIVEVLDHPQAVQQAREEAREMRDGLAWPVIGQRVLSLLRGERDDQSGAVTDGGAPQTGPDPQAPSVDPAKG